ncbi:type VI secretion system baseplate subunit TssF [Morganella psychrotolerans]|uniref:type VI secretion system baseplate subunit TssF n=1 Tax=Morganella psychrotolerans TaxID=368603 RepID=UPI0039B0BC53
MSEFKFLQEKHYLQQLSREFVKEYPHLADVLDPHDEQSGSLLEGFAFLSARLQEKVDDAFPEITLPLLQRLQSRAIKGIPATAIVQFDSGGKIDFPLDIPAGTVIKGINDEIFTTCNNTILQPYTLINRYITHHPSKSCLSLEFKYRGNKSKTETAPFSLFLDKSVSSANTLLLWFCQYFGYIELEHNNIRYHGDKTRFNFIPQVGKNNTILYHPENKPNWPQKLLEGLYIDHVHHFIDIDIPVIVPTLEWEESDSFLLHIYFNKQLPLHNDVLLTSFNLNCVAAVNEEEKKEIILDFQENESVYYLPVDDTHFITELENIQLAFEPHDKERGMVADFYPVTYLTPSSRLLPKYKNAWFYALSIDKTITGKNNYYIHFYNSRGETITTPPGLHFRCSYRCIINNPQSNTGDICRLSPLLPDLLTAGNITICTPCYPPITDNKYYWNLLSHYSANGFMLSSVESVKQMIGDYILYQENDRQRSKQINQHLEGLTDINTALEDRLMKGKPYRCLSLTMTLNPEKFDNPGDAFMFTMHLYHFFPFCLSENMLLKMNVKFTDSDNIWYLSPYLLRGYKSLI